MPGKYSRRMVWAGRDLSDHLVPTSAIGTDASHQTRLFTAPCSLAFNASREGACTTSLGNLFQWLTTLTVKHYFLVSSPNLPSSSLKPFPLVPSQHALIKCPSPAFL